MKLTPKASTAVDLIIQTALNFQEQLAVIDSSISVMTDAMIELKNTGDILENTVAAMQSACERLQNLPKVIKSLEVIGPTCDFIINEMEES